MKTTLIIGAAIAAVTLAACATPATKYDPQSDLGLLWVKHSAEYKAVAAQVYRAATRDLPRFKRDPAWDALRGPGERSALPPAVILDIDETVVSNVDFQLTFERPFENHKLDTWSSNYNSLAIPGVVSFVDIARTLDVTVFFVTNRPCQPKEGTDDPCPQKQTTIDDIRELGIDVDAEHVMLSGERPGWDKEKLTRREYVAQTHRVIMLIGDDFSDFVPCSREKPAGPCTEAATRESRAAQLEKYKDFWGNGWYILPNPMHGSWTSVR